MQRIFSSFSGFLGRNKENITALGSTIQALAITVGIAVTVNELVHKDRLDNVEDTNRTLEFRKEWQQEKFIKAHQASFEWAKKDSFDTESEEYEAAVNNGLVLLRFYDELQICIDLENFNNEHAERIFCGGATNQLNNMIKSMEALQLQIGPTWRGILKFSIACMRRESDETDVMELIAQWNEIAGG